MPFFCLFCCWLATNTNISQKFFFYELQIKNVSFRPMFDEKMKLFWLVRHFTDTTYCVELRGHIDGWPLLMSCGCVKCSVHRKRNRVMDAFKRISHRILEETKWVRSMVCPFGGYIYIHIGRLQKLSESKRMWERKPSEKREKVGLFHTFIYCVENADYTPMLPYLPEHMRTRSPYSSRMTSGTLWMNLHSCLFVWRFYWYGILMFYFFFICKSDVFCTLQRLLSRTKICFVIFFFLSSIAGSHIYLYNLRILQSNE